MTGALTEMGERVRLLRGSLDRLATAAKPLQLAPLTEREWYSLLLQKLLPQLGAETYLVVAVVGGTNIGKSVIFNHLARGRASATSPLASGTKHPTCLLPAGFTERHTPAEIFTGFTLVPWSDADAALEETGEDRLFWRTDAGLPENLLILDTPDIDSDAPVNWGRAKHVRRAADVLIAVLTQQKYNDAAVKEFFRQAAREGKAVLIVFNQIMLPDDEDIWPQWVRTFCDETGIEPLGVYLAPADRAAAEENRLPFFRRNWPVTIDGAERAAGETSDSIDLSAELSELRFDEIKLRTLNESLRELLDADTGVPSYLNEIRERSGEFRVVAEGLEEELTRPESELGPRANWPSVPPSLMAKELDRWWKPQMKPLARNVLGFYDGATRAIAWPFRKAYETLSGQEPDPGVWADYREREWEAIVAAVERNVGLLRDKAETGHPVYREQFRDRLAGRSLEDLLGDLKTDHTEVNLDSVLASVVERGMATFQSESPRHFQTYRTMLHAAAAIRPATSAVLFAFGFGPASDAVAAPVVSTAVGHLVADFVGGTTVLAGGELAVEKAGQTFGSTYQQKILQLHALFQAERVSWLVGFLKDRLWGDLPRELATAGNLMQSPELLAVRECLTDLGLQVAEKNTP